MCNIKISEYCRGDPSILCMMIIISTSLSTSLQLTFRSFDQSLSPSSSPTEKVKDKFLERTYDMLEGIYIFSSEKIFVVYIL